MASKNVRITTLPPSLHFPWPLVRSTMLLLDEEKKKKKRKKKNVFATITNFFANVNAFLVDSISTLPEEIVKWETEGESRRGRRSSRSTSFFRRSTLA